MESASSAAQASTRFPARLGAGLLLLGWLLGCGVRANPRPPLPETYAPPAPDAGPDAGH
ncbi:MAG: hypothetical protein ACLQDQ_03715 [Myxococcaceae bacterium]